MPDADQILLFVLQVTETPVQYVATMLGGLGILLVLVFKFKELLQKWTS